MSLLVHEVAKKVKIHIYTIKLAEKRRLISPQRDVNRYQRYSPDVVYKLKKLYAVSYSEQPPSETT